MDMHLAVSWILVDAVMFILYYCLSKNRSECFYPGANWIKSSYVILLHTKTQVELYQPAV